MKRESTLKEHVFGKRCSVEETLRASRGYVEMEGERRTKRRAGEGESECGRNASGRKLIGAPGLTFPAHGCTNMTFL